MLVSLLLPLFAFPPATVLALLLGMANASLVFLVVGRSPLRLPVYLLCGAVVAAAVQPASLALATTSPLLIGEVSLPLVSLAVWAALGVARALGL